MTEAPRTFYEITWINHRGTLLATTRLSNHAAAVEAYYQTRDKAFANTRYKERSGLTWTKAFALGSFDLTEVKIVKKRRTL